MTFIMFSWLLDIVYPLLPRKVLSCSQQQIFINIKKCFATIKIEYQHSCSGVGDKQNFIALFWEVISEARKNFQYMSKRCPKKPHSLQSYISMFWVQHWQLPKITHMVLFDLTDFYYDLETCKKTAFYFCKLNNYILWNWLILSLFFQVSQNTKL